MEDLRITPNGEKKNEISNEQLRELKMMFDYFDTDNSGALDSNVVMSLWQELGQLIQMIMGGEATEEEKLDLLAEVDQDGNGNIEY